MTDQNKLFTNFLFERINTKMGDIRDAGSHEEIEVYLDDLEAYIDGLKRLVEVVEA